MFTLPPLPYAFAALEPYIDALTMEIHHDKHHGTYVKNLNDLVLGKSEADLTSLLSDPNPKIKNNAGGHLNHSLFWPMLSPTPSSPPSSLLSPFGSIDKFKEEFTAKALSVFGSGWTWLVVDSGKLSIVTTPNQESPKNPILGLDVWEHAYYLKYQNRRADYIAAWWNVVNWASVSARFESAPA